MGGIYKEQKENNPLPIISDPAKLITKSPMSHKGKKLIVLHNFTSLKTCTCVMREMRDTSTDIIVVSNELFCKDEIAKDFDKYFSRGCNIIEVTSLSPISITQRIVYALLEKNSFIARDADHIVFTLLSEYSRGAATIVHLLASLMQKCGDSRTGFERAKQQLKYHIAHQKSLKTYKSPTTSTKNGTSKIDSGFSSLSNTTSSSSHSLPTNVTKPNTEDTTAHSDTSSPYSSLSSSAKSSDTLDTFGYTKSDSDYESLQNDNKTSTGSDPTEVLLSNNADDSDSKNLQQKNIVMDLSTGQNFTEDETVTVDRFMEQPDGFNSSDEVDVLPDDIKDMPASSQHSFHLYINDLLTSDEFFPAHHLLNCLCVIGSIPIPLFIIEELDKVITKAATNKSNRVYSSMTPLIQQLEPGVLRMYPYVFLYHKDFDPKFMDVTSKLMHIPKLFCDVTKSNMSSGDVALSVTCVQHAVKNVIMKMDINQLTFLFIILNQLDKYCSNLHEKFNEENIKLKVQVAYLIRLREEVLT